MKSKIRIYCFAMCVFLAALPAFSMDKQEVYKKMLEKYSSMNSLRLNFSSRQNSKLSGSLKASKGNKYKIVLGDRIIVSNGKSVWNYSISQKNVSISPFESSKGGFSIERFFFEFLNGYKPETMTLEADSRGRKCYSLLMKPPKKMADMPSYIKIRINMTDFSIMSVGSDIGHGFENFDLKGISVNPKIKDAEYSFKPPKGTEVIDLR